MNRAEKTSYLPSVFLMICHPKQTMCLHQNAIILAVCRLIAFVEITAGWLMVLVILRCYCSKHKCGTVVQVLRIEWSTENRAASCRQGLYHQEVRDVHISHGGVAERSFKRSQMAIRLAAKSGRGAISARSRAESKASDV